MLNISIGLVLISSMALIFLAFYKLCILDNKLDGHTIALLLIIFGVCSIGGDTIVPTVLSRNWDLIGQASLMAGVFIWIIGDKRRVGSFYDRKDRRLIK